MELFGAAPCSATSTKATGDHRNALRAGPDPVRMDEEPGISQVHPLKSWLAFWPSSVTGLLTRLVQLRPEGR